MIECPNCGKAISAQEGTLTCPHCGAAVRNGRIARSGRTFAGILGLLTAAVLFGVIAASLLFLGKRAEAAASAASVESVTISMLSEPMFYPGERTVLKALIEPETENSPKIEWSSSDESVAQVDGDGLVKFISEGEATITASVQNGPAASVDVTVLKRAIAVVIEERDIRLKQGEKLTLTPHALPEDASLYGLKWTCSDPNVLSVDENGNVIAIYNGRAKVTAELSNGVKTEVEIFVYRFEFDLLADRIVSGGEYDPDGNCYYYELEYRSEKDSRGETVWHYVELIYFMEDEVISLCYDIYDDDVTEYYETTVEFVRGYKKEAYVCFRCAASDPNGGGVSPLSAYSSEANGEAVIHPNEYLPGDQVELSIYKGKTEFKSIAEEIVNTMLTYEMTVLRNSWESLQIGAAMGDALGLERM